MAKKFRPNPVAQIAGVIAGAMTSPAIMQQNLVYAECARHKRGKFKLRQYRGEVQLTNPKRRSSSRKLPSSRCRYAWAETSAIFRIPHALILFFQSH